MVRIKKLVSGTVAVAFAIAAFAAMPASASPVSIQVNGQAVNFDQPPIERAGRVFVPLRGVFERLGASVVYANGEINAQGNSRNVQLHIGSRQATVNGQQQYIDVAPFLVGARTLVPLRFVAQALGAVVNYNGSNRTVSINGNGYNGSNGGGYNNGGNANTPPPNASFYLKNKQPATTSSTLLPLIAADFSEPVNRDSLRVSIDGNDVTGQAYSSDTGFRVTPSGALSAGTHRVRVTGTTQAGSSFATSWSFTAQNGGTVN
ncbi:MAG: stalk domain-containing protein, partial [Candidatus Eremiobacteraeota bacterium]|nr:stalk domain-containing protein [Candidatus Eremiobacteraeota bacterium]